MTNNDELALKLAKLAKNAGADEWQAKEISGDPYVIRKGSYRVESGFCTYQEIAEIDDNSTRVFVACASPANILALLAERDADKKRIAKLQEHISSLDEGVNMLLSQYDQLASAIGWTTEKALAGDGNQEQYAEAIVKRIAELEALIAEQDKRLITYADIATKNASEARTVSVKLPSLNPEMFNDDVMFGYRKAQKEAVEFCAAAGIKLEVGE